MTRATPAVPATAPWTHPRAWPRTGSSATAEVSVIVAPANAQTSNSRAQPARSAPPAPESVRSTSESRRWRGSVFRTWADVQAVQRLFKDKRIPGPSLCVFFCRDCVLCRAFPSEKSCANCNYFDLVTVSDRDQLPQPTDQSFPLTHCKVRDENDCWVYYTFAIKNQTKMVYVVEKPGMREAPSSQVHPLHQRSRLFQAALRGPTSSPSWQAWSLVSF